MLVDISEEKVWVVDVRLNTVIEFNVREGVYVVGIMKNGESCIVIFRDHCIFDIFFR